MTTETGEEIVSHYSNFADAADALCSIIMPQLYSAGGNLLNAAAAAAVAAASVAGTYDQSEATKQSRNTSSSPTTVCGSNSNNEPSPVKMQKRDLSPGSSSNEPTTKSAIPRPLAFSRGPQPSPVPSSSRSPTTLYVQADDVQAVEIIASPACHHSHWGDLRHSTAPHERRTEHWQQCILPLQFPQTRVELLNDLARTCARLEGRDVLTTVDLVRPPSVRSKARQMLADTLDGQLPDSDDENLAESKTVSHYLDPKNPTQDVDFGRGDYWCEIERGQIQQLYANDAYRTEAEHRFRAVKRVTEYLYTTAHTERTMMLESFAFRLCLGSLRRMCSDPREELLQRVAVYHVMLNTGFDHKNFEKKPLV
jgi:hypothetical protein